MTVSLAVVGLGAIGQKHLEAIARIPDADVRYIVDSRPERARELAEGSIEATYLSDYRELLLHDDLDGVILATPSPLHHGQAREALDAGKHVLVEIPMGQSLGEVRDVVQTQQRTGLVAMAGHTRRFNISHQFVHQRIRARQFSIQQLDVQTYFLRRTNSNALGEPRSWTDHLLWHHAAHTVDLFLHQTSGIVDRANIIQGPKHPELGIAMDMSIQLGTTDGAICTLSLSFNNDGPLGSTFRYIGDTATYVARDDTLFTGRGDEVDLSGHYPSASGIELQDREFIAAIAERRSPTSSVDDVLPCYVILEALRSQLR